MHNDRKKPPVRQAQPMQAEPFFKPKDSQAGFFAQSPTKEDSFFQPKVQLKQKADSAMPTGIQNEQGGSATRELEGNLSSQKGQGSQLDKDTRERMEQGIGHDFSGVNVHTDGAAAQMNRQLGARAFTHGNDIYFNQGEYQPGTTEGDRLLAHELTHTVQQGNGGGISAGQHVQLSPLSDELSGIWTNQGKGPFYERLRAVAPVNDPDFTTFMHTLSGDDYWLTSNIATYGREASWPIHLRVEREMKPWGDTSGKGAVFEILRAAAGAEAANANLSASLAALYPAGTDDYWLANNLQLYGREASWPIHLRVEREMKPWGDTGGKGAVFEILRAAAGAEAANANLSASLATLYPTGTDDYWLANNLQLYGREATWPIHLRVEREMKNWGDTGGKGAVFEILRAANALEAANAALTTSLHTVFQPGTDDIWLAELLQQYGPEANWPLNKKIERELKGWGDSGGYAAILVHIGAADDAAKKLVLNDAHTVDEMKAKLTNAQVVAIVDLLVNLGTVRAGRIREATAALFLSAEAVDHNTAIRIINGTIIPYYIEDLTVPADASTRLTNYGFSPTVYNLYLSPIDSRVEIIAQQNFVGFQNSGVPNYIFGQRGLSLDRWRTLLVHETSHAVNSDSANADNSIAYYKGEFRAYWLAEYRGVTDLDDRARQIKAHILRDYHNIRTRYNAEPAFKALVDAHTRPDGNVTNQ